MVLNGEGWEPGFLYWICSSLQCVCIYIPTHILSAPSASKPHRCAMPAFEGRFSIGQVRGAVDTREVCTCGEVLPVLATQTPATDHTH